MAIIPSKHPNAVTCRNASFPEDITQFLRTLDVRFSLNHLMRGPAMSGLYFRVVVTIFGKWFGCATVTSETSFSLNSIRFIIRREYSR